MDRRQVLFQQRIAVDHPPLSSEFSGEIQCRRFELCGSHIRGRCVHQIAHQRVGGSSVQHPLPIHARGPHQAPRTLLVLTVTIKAVLSQCPSKRQRFGRLVDVSQLIVPGRDAGGDGRDTTQAWLLITHTGQHGGHLAGIGRQTEDLVAAGLETVVLDPAQMCGRCRGQPPG